MTKQKIGALALLSLGSGAALAQESGVPSAFTSAVSTATTAGVSMMTALIGVAAAIVVVKIAMGYVKALRGAAK